MQAQQLVEVEALLKAGWSFELPEIVNNERMETEPWQWYWRSPPKRKNSKGRKYWSTTQAYNAMRRIIQDKGESVVRETGETK